MAVGLFRLEHEHFFRMGEIVLQAPNFSITTGY